MFFIKLHFQRTWVDIANDVKQQTKIKSEIYQIHVHTAKLPSATNKSPDIVKHGEGAAAVRWTSPNKPPLKRRGLSFNLWLNHHQFKCIYWWSPELTNWVLYSMTSPKITMEPTRLLIQLSKSQSSESTFVNYLCHK